RRPSSAIQKSSLDHQCIARAEKRKDTLKHIQKSVEQRWENLRLNPKKMINSVLDRPRKSIVMDHLISENISGDITITTDKDEIKNKVRNHFYNWTSKRNTDILLMNKWAEFYNPLPDVDVNWYNSLLLNVEIDELIETITSLPNKKAPGQSNLQYEWFKHLPMAGLEQSMQVMRIRLKVLD
ncbi:23749_t:CDS:2, partial [Dentiscutata erythropus]